MLRFSYCVFLMLFSAHLLSADLIYSNFGADYSFLPDSANPNSNNIVCFFPFPCTNQAAAFTPAVTAPLGSIILALSVYNPDGRPYSLQPPVAMTVDLATSQPGEGLPYAINIPSSTVVESFALTADRNTGFIYDLQSVTHPSLSAGTQYWIVITNGTYFTPFVVWNENPLGFSGNSEEQDKSRWINYNGIDPAFAVIAQPEPSTLTLSIVTCLCGFLRYRRRFFCRSLL
jgi:hypothetical protein